MADLSNFTTEQLLELKKQKMSQQAQGAATIGGVGLPQGQSLPQAQPQPLSVGGGVRPSSGMSFLGGTYKGMKFGESPEIKAQREIEEASIKKATEEAATTESKLNRLDATLDVIERKFIETSPYSRKDIRVKSGLMPILGAWDVAKSPLQATSAQEKDLEYRDFLGSIRAVIARGWGDVGNLSWYEQRAVLGGMPNLLNTKEVGLKKTQNLRDLINAIKENRRKGRVQVGKDSYTPLKTFQENLTQAGITPVNPDLSSTLSNVSDEQAYQEYLKIRGK